MSLHHNILCSCALCFSGAYCCLKVRRSFADAAARTCAQADPDIPPFHYGSHYSTAGVVLFYLLRLEPFTGLSRTLQVPPSQAPLPRHVILDAKLFKDRQCCEGHLRHRCESHLWRCCEGHLRHCRENHDIAVRTTALL